MIKTTFGCLATSALLLSLATIPSGAATFSFTGDLRADATVLGCGPGCTLGAANSDGDYAQFAAVVRSFTVSTLSNVQALTFSYGGGTNGNGQSIAEGGFEPYLSLFDSGGNFIASTFSGTTCYAGANTNSASGQCFDVLLDAGVLPPSTYQIAISAFLNLSSAENLGVGTLADGFTGLGNLAGGEDLHYAFDVVLTDATPVPEPRTISIVAFAALSIFGFLLKSRRLARPGASR